MQFKALKKKKGPIKFIESGEITVHEETLGPPIEESWNLDDAPTEELSWDLEEIHPEAAKIKENKRKILVEIGYKADQTMNQGTMLKEVVAMRGTIPDWTPDRWAEYMHTVGASPFWVTWPDLDRYHLLIYAAEILRENPEFRHHGLRHLRGNPDFNPNERDTRQEGTMWGGVDDELGGPGPEPTIAIAHVTVREQVAQKTADNIEANRPVVKPMEPWQPNEQDSVYLKKWKLAHNIARKCNTRTEVEEAIEKYKHKKNHEAFALMINYCFDWVRKIGSVPNYPLELTDLFWPRPKMIDGQDKTVARRAKMTERVIMFWRKQVAKNLKGYDPDLHTYRAVRACIKLDEAIEGYARNYQTGVVGKEPGSGMVYKVTDEEWEERVKGAAKMYFQSKFPLKLEGADPGPLDTLDPSYVDYVLLCRKYGIAEGTLLHKAKFDKQAD